MQLVMRSPKASPRARPRRVGCHLLQGPPEDGDALGEFKRTRGGVDQKTQLKLRSVWAPSTPP
eukprot:8476825-Pyramimonas_sp.AAC.1